MDKSLGTNLHLWRFFTRAKQTVWREFNYTCSASSPPPPHTMLDISQEFQHCMGRGGGGGAETNFEKDKSAFSNSVFKIQIIHAMMQVSTIVVSNVMGFISAECTIGMV